MSQFYFLKNDRYIQIKTIDKYFIFSICTIYFVKYYAQELNLNLIQYYNNMHINKTFIIFFVSSELAAELFTEVKSGHTLEKLDVEEASKISRNACVSPCSLVLALLYIERLKNCNPEYLHQVAPSELFLVSLVIVF